AQCSFSVTVTADPPIANADALGAVANHLTTVLADKLVSNDSGAPGTTLSVTGVSSSSTNGGTVSLSAGVISYTPVPNFSGADLFTYTLSDGCSTTNGSVLVTVTSE